MASQAQVDVATALANSIKTEELGKNEARLMAYASAVLKGLKEINFQAIATLTAQLMKDHAIAQIVGWPAVEAMREKKELLALGLSTEEADELSSMKLKAKVNGLRLTLATPFGLKLQEKKKVQKLTPRAQRRRERALPRRNNPRKGPGGPSVGSNRPLAEGSPLNSSEEIYNQWSPSQILSQEGIEKKRRKTIDIAGEEDSRTRLIDWLNRRTERQGNNEGKQGEGEVTRNNPAPIQDNDTETEPSDSDSEEEEDDTSAEIEDEPEEMEDESIHFQQPKGNEVITPQFDYNFSVDSPKSDPAFPKAINSILNKGFVLKPIETPLWRTKNYEKGLYQVKGEAAAMMNALQRDGIIEPCPNPRCISPITFIRKANGKPRLIHDLRQLNSKLPEKPCFYPKISR